MKSNKFNLLFVIVTLMIPFTGFSAELECETLSPLMGAFVARHYSFKNLGSDIENRSVERYIKVLDPSKIYFMQSDINEIKANLKDVFKKLKEKNCSDLDKTQKLYVKRISESLDYARKELGENFKFQENITLVTDPQKREYPKDRSELENLQQKYLQFQIANYLSSDMKLADARKQLTHRYEVFLKHATETKPGDVYSSYLVAFATSLDPHSDYLSKDVFEDFNISMSLSLEGIGATLRSEDGYTVIENLIPGGAAAKSGDLESKDKILAVGQGESGAFEPVMDMALRDVVRLIRGKKGTKVRLSILRQGKETKRFTSLLTRAKIDLEDEAAKIKFVDKTVSGKKLKLAVIDLPSFYYSPGEMMDPDGKGKERSCAEDVKKLIKEAVDKKVDGIVLDLSKNGGGVLGEAVRIGGFFIKKGNIVETQESTGHVETLADLDSTLNYSGPLVVLTSRFSASASEIVAGALRDYKRGVIIGSDRTFGKGSVQAVIRLKDLGAIKVTTGMFFVPGGDSTQEKGVPSDIRIPSPWASKEMSEDALDYALPKKSLPSFLSPEANNTVGQGNFIPLDKDTLSFLRESSSARVTKDAEFKKIETELKETEDRKGVVKIADMMKKTSEQNAKDKFKPKSKKFGEDPDYLVQPAMKEALNVLVDLVQYQNKIVFANNLKGKKGEHTAADSE